MPETITDAFCLLDRQYRFTYVNHPAEEVLGRSSQELLGKDARVEYALESEALEGIGRVMGGAEPAQFEIFSPSFRRSLGLAVYPNPDGVSLLFRDLGQQARSDEEQRRLYAIVESSEDAIISKDLQGIITSWNVGAERLFGYTAEEIVGKPISTLMPPGHRQDMVHILERIRRGERVEHFETVRISKEGRHIPVSLSVSPIKDAAGRIVGAAKIARDITRLKEAEEARERLYREAQQAIEVRDTFLSVAGHEFRTPLNALSLQLYNILRAAENPAQREALEKAALQVDRLARLTHQLLDVSRMASEGFALERAPMDLTELVTEVVDRMRESAVRSGSPVSLQTPGPVVGNWDRSRLDQVTTNLIDNAVKFGRGKPVEVSVEAPDHLARVRVRDHGIGVADSDRERIFERFERAVSDRSFGGMGLGLWISDKIVEAHGGRIGLENPAGGGAEFFYELHRPEGGQGADPDRG